MSDVHDRVHCSTSGDTSRLFSTENGTHKGLQPLTESHNTSRTFASLRTEPSHGSPASSQRPLSSKLHEEGTCQFAKKALPRIRLCHEERLKTIPPKSLEKLLCTRDSFEQVHVSMEGNRKRVRSLKPSFFTKTSFPKNRQGADSFRLAATLLTATSTVSGGICQCSCSR